MVNSPCLIDNNVMAVKARHEAVDRYVHFFLRTVDFSRTVRSTTVPSLRKGDIESLALPLAPRAEQQRIADKLDTVLASVDACGDRLARAAPLLKRFRQSVLASATAGRLTEDWRAANGVEIDHHIAWAKRTLGTIAIDLRYGTAKKCDYQQNGIGVLRIPNIAEGGRISVKDLKRAEFTPAELHSLRLAEGDLLIIRSNGSVDLVGRTSVVTAAEVGLLFAGYLIRLRIDFSGAVPQFVYLSLCAPALRTLIESTAKSTSGVNNINSEELRRLPLMLPSLAEQTEMVRRVETLFAFADRLEARLAQARTAVDRLTPSLLAKAFRGELVPQDPADEPAAELLKRMSASRTAEAPRTRRGRQGQPA